MSEYEVDIPAYFSDAEFEYTAKGFFQDVTITTSSAIFRPVFFDLGRFVQEIKDQFESGETWMAEPGVVIVKVLDREHIEAAVRGMAESDFAALRGVS